MHIKLYFTYFTQVAFFLFQLEIFNKGSGSLKKECTGMPKMPINDG